MINKKIAMSGLSIVTALALAGGATFAFFSDTATSSNNTFSTGTLDLVLSDSNESGAQSVTASFGGELAPGTCTGVQTLNLRNDGSVAADHAEVTVSNVVTDANDPADPGMHSLLRINSLTYDGGDVLTQIPNVNGNTFKDLADWEATPGALDNLSLTNLLSSHPLAIDVCLDETADNTVQGDSVVSTFTATLNQDASQ